VKLFVSLIIFIVAFLKLRELNLYRKVFCILKGLMLI